MATRYRHGKGGTANGDADPSGVCFVGYRSAPQTPGYRLFINGATFQAHPPA